ncbi:MAG: RHS repeat-associated core domain-containing protein [Chloroflexi bacterium]|nr:RHS repeat-associated core domain-containing protein [Chloroflexota bacterium]
MWADGSLRSRLRYDPWGKERYAQYATPSGYRYTSQRWDSGLGLYDYNARYYDPTLGKFISADTLVPEQKRLTPLAVAFHENQFLEKVNQENGQITQFGPISSWNAQQKEGFWGI